MIEDIIKKYFKTKTYVVDFLGLVVTYKVNVNVWNKMNSYGTSYVVYIDLNIKILDCRRKLWVRGTEWEIGDYNIFKEGVAVRGDYRDCRSVVRVDMNRWVAPMFSTYFYVDCYTILCTNTKIKINTYTFK